MHEFDGVAQILDENGSHAGMAIVVGMQHVMTCAHVVNQALGRPDFNTDKPLNTIAIRLWNPTRIAVTGRVKRWGLTDAIDGPLDVAVLELDEALPENISPAGFSEGEAKGAEWKVLGQHKTEHSLHWTTERDSRVSSLTEPPYIQLDAAGDASRWIDHGDSGAAVWCEKLGAVIGMVATKHPDVALTRISKMISVGALQAFWPIDVIGDPISVEVPDFLEQYRVLFQHHHARWDLRPTGFGSGRTLRQTDTPLLDDMYVPLRLGKDPEPSWREDATLLSPTQIRNLRHSIVISGGAGSGKTTWMRWTFRRLIRDPRTVPFLIELRDVAFRWKHLQSRGQKRSIEAYLIELLEENGLLGMREHLRAVLGGSSFPQRPILMLDGWDELGPLGEEIRRKLVTLLVSYPRMLAIVTSRPYGEAKPSSSEDFRVLHFQPLTSREIEALAYRFYVHFEKRPVEDGKAAQEEFMDQLGRSESASDLARTALMLAMMLLKVGQSGKFVNTRHQLYHACLENMLAVLPARKQAGGALPSLEEFRPETEEETFAAVGGMAFELFTGDSAVEQMYGNTLSTWEELAMAIPGDWPEYRRYHFINWLTGSAGLLIDRLDRKISFVHRSFQEYLAAWHFNVANYTLAERMSVLRNCWANSDRWETIRIWAVLAHQNDTQVLDEVLEELIANDIAGLSLAGSILSDGIGSDWLFEQWCSRLIEVIEYEWPSLVGVCASSWRASNDEGRRNSIQSRFSEAISSVCWLGWFRISRFAQFAGIELDASQKPKDFRPDTNLSGVEVFAQARIFHGACGAEGNLFESGNGAVPELLLWPTYRRLCGYRLQNLAILTQDRALILAMADTILRSPMRDAVDGSFVADCRHDLAKHVDAEQALDLARYFARDWPRYVGFPWTCDLARQIVAHWYTDRNGGGAGGNAFYWTDILLYYERPFHSSGPFTWEWARNIAIEWAHKVGLTNASDALAAQFGLIELMSVGRAHTRADFSDPSHRESQSNWSDLMATASRLSLSSTSDSAKSVRALKLAAKKCDPLFVSLARYLCRQANESEQKFLVESAKNAHHDMEAVQQSLQYFVRGDFILRDGTNVTLDELCDQLEIPYLPYLDAPPPPV